MERIVPKQTTSKIVWLINMININNVDSWGGGSVSGCVIRRLYIKYTQNEVEGDKHARSYSLPCFLICVLFVQ